MIRRIPKDIRDRHDSRLSLKQKVEVKPRATKTGVVEFHFRLHLFFFPDSSPPVEKPPRGTGETWMEKSLGRGRFGTSPDELEASWREGSSFAARGTSFRFKADAGASRGLSSARESLFLSRAFSSGNISEIEEYSPIRSLRVLSRTLAALPCWISISRAESARLLLFPSSL